MVTLNNIPVANPFDIRLMFWQGGQAVASIEPEDARVIDNLAFDQIQLVPGYGVPPATFTQTPGGAVTIPPGYVISFVQAAGTLSLVAMSPLLPVITVDFI